MTNLKAEKREKFGKSLDEDREGGVLPAELYGHGVENKHIFLSTKEFERALDEAGESSIITLTLGEEKYPVLINEIQHNPLGDIIHVDLRAVKMDEKITTETALNFIGEAPAVKDKGGVLVKSLEVIEIEALPLDLPSSIDVDISKLEEIHDLIHVGDLDIPEKVEVNIDAETVVVSVTEPAEEEPEEEEAEEGEVGIESEESSEETESESSQESEEGSAGEETKE